MSGALRVAGVMSGTSLDGIDVAVVDLRDEGSDVLLRFLGCRTQPFPPDLKSRLLGLWGRGAAHLFWLTELNVELGEVFAAATQAALREMDISRVDLVASHGQTIYHQAVPRLPATLQMGEPAVLARRLGTTMVADFRPADIAAGGQGAPLVACFDALFFAPGVAVQNIGGIGNVTVIRRDGSSIAFDTGPGNAMVDRVVRRYGLGEFDRDGDLARHARVHEPLVEEVLSHPYFALPPPKATGREDFGDEYADAIAAVAELQGRGPEEVVATLTAVTARSIATAYRDFAPDIEDVVLSGGGADNPVLVAMIADALPHVRIRRHDDFGIPADTKEAVAFAFLGYQCLLGRPSQPCSGYAPSVLGKITPGENYRALMKDLFGEGRDPWTATRRIRLVS